MSAKETRKAYKLYLQFTNEAQSNRGQTHTHQNDRRTSRTNQLTYTSPPCHVTFGASDWLRSAYFTRTLYATLPSQSHMIFTILDI